MAAVESSTKKVDETKKAGLVGKDVTEESAQDAFITHLKSGFIIEKIKSKSLSGVDHRVRRVLFCDEDGLRVNWRAVDFNDYKDVNLYMMENAEDPHEFSKTKTPIPLYTLQRVMYNHDDMLSDGRFKIRLDFKGHRKLDFECTNVEDFDYCIKGFEYIKKNRDRYQTPEGEFRPHLMHDYWDHSFYEPLVFKFMYQGKEVECPVGCGNDIEDILLISSCYGCLWSFLLAFFALLLKGVLDSDESSTLLMMFLFLGIFFVVCVFGAVYTGGIEEKAKLRKKEAKWRRAGGEDVEEDDL